VLTYSEAATMRGTHSKGVRPGFTLRTRVYAATFRYPMLCTKCGTQIPDRAVVCVNCGATTESGVARTVSAKSSGALRMVIPIGRSGYAIAAGYIGLFSVLVIPAPFAIIFGFLALKDIKRHPEKTGKGRAWFAIVMGILVVLLVAVAAIIGRR
jgi:Domain of unknown function (DUF4190)/zinc-ribbon domain